MNGPLVRIGGGGDHGPLRGDGDNEAPRGDLPRQGPRVRGAPPVPPSPSCSCSAGCRPRNRRRIHLSSDSIIKCFFWQRLVFQCDTFHFQRLYTGKPLKHGRYSTPLRRHRAHADGDSTSCRVPCSGSLPPPTPPSPVAQAPAAESGDDGGHPPLHRPRAPIESRGPEVTLIPPLCFHIAPRCCLRLTTSCSWLARLGS